MITDAMPDIAAGNKAIGLINMGEAYGTLIKKELKYNMFTLIVHKHYVVLN